MTLIATLRPSSIPVLFGDLLISADERIGPPLQIPGVGSAHQIFPEGSGYTPVGFNQKISLINEHLAVAWAGTKYKARGVIKDLSALQEPIAIDRIMKYFSKIPLENDVCFMGILVDETTGKPQNFWHGNFSKRQTQNFGEIIAAGTGLDHFGKTLDLIETIQCAPPKVSIIKKFPFLSDFNAMI